MKVNDAGPNATGAVRNAERHIVASLQTGGHANREGLELSGPLLKFSTRRSTSIARHRAAPRLSRRTGG
jgi:hypothetical protein